jgi:ElaB/YqjD/DUF883 family membrane-anchored ribosome-binding protein
VALKGAQPAAEIRINKAMINPNGDEFRDDPSTSPTGSTEGAVEGRWRSTAGRVSDTAASTWQQTKQGAATARERTEFFLRENPVPTIIGALVLGLAIGIAIRYASEDRETEVKTPAGNLHLGALSLPLLLPMWKSIRRKAEDATDYAKEGVDRLKKIDVDDYVKPLRKKWKAWAN